MEEEVFASAHQRDTREQDWVKSCLRCRGLDWSQCTHTSRKSPRQFQENEGETGVQHRTNNELMMNFRNNKNKIE